MDTYHVEQIGNRWIVCNQRREQIGGAVDDAALAWRLAHTEEARQTAARVSREDTRRELGCYYDPAD